MSGLQSRVLLAPHGSQIKEILGQLVDSSVVPYFREKLRLFNTDGSRGTNEQSTIWNKIVYHCLWLAVQTLFRKRSPRLLKVLTEDCKSASSEAASPASPGRRKVTEPQIYSPEMGLDTKSNISYDFGQKQCGNLNKNVPRRVMYLNTWFLVGGDVWGERGPFLMKSLAGATTSLGVGL